MMGVGVELALGLTALFVMHAALMKTNDRKLQIIAVLGGSIISCFCMVDMTGV